VTEKTAAKGLAPTMGKNASSTVSVPEALALLVEDVIDVEELVLEVELEEPVTELVLLNDCEDEDDDEETDTEDVEEVDNDELVVLPVVVVDEDSNTAAAAAITMMTTMTTAITTLLIASTLNGFFFRLDEDTKVADSVALFRICYHVA
jgi:hypothetical protein